MKQINYVSADEAVKVVKSGDHIHFSSVASAPQCLIQALCRRGDAGELEDVRIHHLHTEGPAPYADEKYSGIFFHQGFFIGGNVRKGVQSGYADYIPVFLSETQKLRRTGNTAEMNVVAGFDNLHSFVCTDIIYLFHRHCYSFPIISFIIVAAE